MVLVYRVSPDQFKRLADCKMKSMSPVFKIEMFIYQLEANLIREIFFRKITHHLDQQIRKMLIKGMFVNEDSTFHSGP